MTPPIKMKNMTKKLFGVVIIDNDNNEISTEYVNALSERSAKKKVCEHLTKNNYNARIFNTFIETRRDIRETI